MYATEEINQALRVRVRQWVEHAVAPCAGRIESAGTVEHELVAAIATQGWIGVTIDRKYGGMSAGHEAKTVIIEGLSRVSAAMGAAAQASMLGSAPILHFGNREQKQEWLPRIAAGEALPTIAVTERGSGGWVLGMETTARRSGGDYVLDGHKVYVGNSHIGDVHCVVARTGGEGSRALSAFLVESGSPGLTLVEHKPMMGLRGFACGELRFDNCRIPAGNLLGGEGDGLDVAYGSSVVYGRPNLTAVSMGIHEAVFEQSLRFAQERHRYGKPIADLPTIAHKLARMQADLMTTRTLTYDAVRRLDRGEPCDAQLMQAKLVVVETTLDSVRRAMEIHAAAGLETDRPLERFIRDAYCTYAPAGTSDIQLHRLGQIALGTYRDQWSQRLNPLAPTKRSGFLRR